jgi:hypothetical protein
MKNKLVAAKNYVQAHPKHCALTATALALVALQNHGIGNLNEFLKENDLFDKYYLSDEI